MILYEKVMQGKKTTYREHIPAPIVMPEIENKQIVTLLSALTISMLMSISEQMPPHATLARRIKGVEESIKALAQLNGEPLDPDLVTAGVSAWNSAIFSLQASLSGEIGGVPNHG
jgi:hypothetical protein